MTPAEATAAARKHRAEGLAAAASAANPSACTVTLGERVGLIDGFELRRRVGGDPSKPPHILHGDGTFTPVERVPLAALDIVSLEAAATMMNVSLEEMTAYAEAALRQTAPPTLVVPQAQPLQAALSSVELSMSTKGVVTWAVKVYGAEPAECMDRANALHEALVLKHGRPT